MELDGPTTALGELFESVKVALAIALLTLGVGFMILGILAATTGLFTGLFGLSVYGSWKLAGVFGGLGLPLVIVGVFTVLPATDHQRLGAAAGLGLVILGVILFALNFPDNWYGDETDRTFLVVSVYFLGTMLTVSYLFLAVANLQTPTQSQRVSSSAPAHVQYRSRNQNPQTAGALIQGVIGLAKESLGDDTDSSGPEIDLEHVAETLSEYMGERIEDVDVQDDHVIVTRSKGTQHAEFTTKLPRYAEIVDRDERKYALYIDAVAFRLVN